MEMKTNRKPAFFVIFTLVLLTASACGKEQGLQMVNEQSFSLKDIEELTISYDDEKVRFFAGEGERLTVKEYMTKNKKSYYAKVEQRKDSIQISEGGKPFFKGGFRRYVEVYLPESYSENLTVTATDGEIDMSAMSLELRSIRVDCTSGEFKLKEAVAEDIYFSSTSGRLELGSLVGDQIKIETTQGEVSCEAVDGNVTYTSTSGDAEFTSATGAGTYKADNSGKLRVTYEEVTGDLSFFNKNDDIELSLPAALSFALEAVTKNGSIHTDFQEDLAAKGDMTCGTVGNDPEVTVRVETKNGKIEVSRCAER